MRGKKHTGRWRHNSKAGVPERAAETHAALRRGGEVCTQPAPHACWNVPDPCGQQAAAGWARPPASRKPARESVKSLSPRSLYTFKSEN